jgi:hypothetical protein
MPGSTPLPAAFASWLARRLAAGAAVEPLAAEYGLAPEVLVEPPIPALVAAHAAAGAGAGEAGRRALLEAAIEALLAQGRPLEAARLARLGAGPGRRAEPAPLDPVERAAREAAVLEEALAEATAEERAEWESFGYEHWVVPPGSERRPLASLTAAWVTAADRWRVLEELARLDDPAERARVLAHFAAAGLDPGADHPAFVGALPPPAPAPPAAEPGPPPDPAEGRDPAFHALLVRLGLEAESYHGAGRARRAALAWQRHAKELGVPVPAQAGLGAEPGGAAQPARPGPGAPPAGPAAPAGWPETVRIRPPEPRGPGWPWAPDDGVPPELLAERAARAPRPAPPPAPPVPTPAIPGPPIPPPPVPTPPVQWAPEPLTPTRLAKLRGDWPWWCQ